MSQCPSAPSVTASAANDDTLYFLFTCHPDGENQKPVNVFYHPSSKATLTRLITARPGESSRLTAALEDAHKSINMAYTHQSLPTDMTEVKMSAENALRAALEARGVLDHSPDIKISASHFQPTVDFTVRFPTFEHTSTRIDLPSHAILTDALMLPGPPSRQAISTLSASVDRATMEITNRFKADLLRSDEDIANSIRSLLKVALGDAFPGMPVEVGEFNRLPALKPRSERAKKVRGVFESLLDD